MMYKIQMLLMPVLLCHKEKTQLKAPNVMPQEQIERHEIPLEGCLELKGPQGWSLSKTALYCPTEGPLACSDLSWQPPGWLLLGG